MAELKREQLLMAVISGRGPAYLRGVNLSDMNLSGVAWLIEADLRQTDLSHTILIRANLKGANLEKADLYSCNLSGANLEGANLREAKMTMSNLKMANLRNADLQGARLVGANLVRADLEEANLEGADLEGAELQGANLWNAKLDSANFRQANLNGALIQAGSLDGAIVGEVPDRVDVGTEVQGFSGVIDSVQLADLIQLICLSRMNSLIRVEAPQGTGTIHILSGRVRHAQAGAIEGEDAFFEMLQWENGHIETASLLDASVSTIDKPLEHLILESMRRRDERSSAGGSGQ